MRGSVCPHKLAKDEQLRLDTAACLKHHILNLCTNLVLQLLSELSQLRRSKPKEAFSYFLLLLLCEVFLLHECFLYVRLTIVQSYMLVTCTV